MARLSPADRPSGGAWLIALSSLLMVIILAALSGILSSELAQRLAHERLSAALQDANWYPGAVERSVAILVNQPYLNYHLSRLVYPSVLENRAEAQELYDIVRLLRLNQPKIAVDRARILLSNLQFRAEDLDSNYESIKLQSLLTKTHDFALQWSNKQRRVRMQQRKLAQAEKEERSITEQLALVAGDLGEIFSLSPHYPKADSQAIALYQAGVLQGLPKLEGLDDGIADLVALRSALQRAGGAVRLQGENQHQVFTQRIEGLQRTTQELLEESHELAQQRKVLLREIEELQTEAGGLCLDLRRSFEELLLRVTSPNNCLLACRAHSA